VSYKTFYYRAEREIDQGIYSESLWSQAYRRANGDKSRAYHIYIHWRADEIRANQPREVKIKKPSEVFGLFSLLCAVISIPAGFIAATGSQFDSWGGIMAGVNFIYIFSSICLLGFMLGTVALVREEKPQHHLACLFCGLGSLPAIFYIVGGVFKLFVKTNA